MQNNRKFHSGLTLIEMVVAMTIATFLVLVVGILLISSQHCWQQTYNSAQKKIKQDAQSVMLTFGIMGRKSNRLNYVLYNVGGSTFTPAAPNNNNDDEVVYGNAAEFRYWDEELQAGDPYDLMNVNKTATAYALFYFDGKKLKVDYGAYPPGGVPSGGGQRNASGITTTILADNVTPDPNGAFSHTTISGVGQGSVRINITLADANNPNDTVKVMTSTMMRNIWPR